MNIKMNVLDYPIDINSENDSIVLTTQGGDQKNNGRISGYSAGELIDPVIEDTGFFEWKDPEYNINGSVFVRPKLLKSVSVLSTGKIGLFDEAVPASDYFKENLVAAGSKIYKNQQYISLLGNEGDVSTHPEAITDSDTKLMVTNAVWNSTYPVKNLLLANANNPIYIKGEESVVTIEFPVITSVSGIYLATKASYNLYDFKMEYSKDGKSWESYGPVDKVSSDTYTHFENLDMNPENSVEGLTFFNEPMLVKALRLKIVGTGTSTQSILSFTPFMDLSNQVVSSSLVYEDIRLDPNSFKMEEANQDMVLSKVAAPDSFDVTNSKSLERSLWLKDDKPVNLKYEQIASFNNPDEFHPGVNATIEHSISGGGIQLEAGVYEAEIELEYYSSDYRLWEEGDFNFHEDQENYVYLIDAVRNIKLTDYRYISNGHFVPNSDVVKYTCDGHNTTDESAKWLAMPQTAFSVNTVLGHYHEESVLTVDIEHKSPIKTDGLTALVGRAQKLPYWVKVESSNGIDGWEVVLDWYNHTDFTNVFKVAFPETTAKIFRISFRHVEVGQPIGRHYVGVSRVFLDYVENPNMLKFMQKFTFRFAVHEGTTVATIVKSTDDAGMLRDRKLKLSKLGPYSARRAFVLATEPKWNDEKYVQEPIDALSNFAQPEFNKENPSVAKWFAFSDVKFITFNVTSPTILHRVGSLTSGARKSAPLKLFKLGAGNEDISNLSFDPIKKVLGIDADALDDAEWEIQCQKILPFTELLQPGTYQLRGDASENRTDAGIWFESVSDPSVEVTVGKSMIHYPYQSEDLVITTSDGSDPLNLLDGNSQTQWISDYAGSSQVYLTLAFDNDTTLMGLYETLSDDIADVDGKVLCGPQRVTVEILEADGVTWRNVNGLTYNEVIGAADEMSLNGTKRVGATNFDDGTVNTGDAIRRYFAFASAVTTKGVRIGIQNGAAGKFLTANEYGVFYTDGSVDFTSL